jgi:hypothetical protein
VDVHYPASGGARAALVLAGDRTFAEIRAQRTAFVAGGPGGSCRACRNPTTPSLFSSRLM